MSVPAGLTSTLKSLVHELVVGNYKGLEADGRAGRLSAQEIERAIIEYGRTLEELPNRAFDVSEAYPINGRPATWAVDLTLWTRQEGRSDLTLSVMAEDGPDGVRVEITDLHVL